MVSVSVEYLVLCTDEENDAFLVKSQYKTITGFLLKVDREEQSISIRSGTETEVETEVLPFSDVCRVSMLTG